jgi:hypothetical protein
MRSAVVLLPRFFIGYWILKRGRISIQPFFYTGCPLQIASLISGSFYACFYIRNIQDVDYCMLQKWLRIFAEDTTGKIASRTAGPVKSAFTENLVQQLAIRHRKEGICEGK